MMLIGYNADVPYHSLALTLNGVQKVSHSIPVVCPNDIQEVLDAILLPEMLPVVLDNRGQVLYVS